MAKGSGSGGRSGRGRAGGSGGGGSGGGGLSSSSTPSEVATAAAAAASGVPDSERVGRGVFISDAFDRLGGGNITLDEFKRKLNQARGSGSITLSRADLAYILDQTKVSRSLIDDGTSTFHFIRL